MSTPRSVTKSSDGMLFIVCAIVCFVKKERLVYFILQFKAFVILSETAEPGSGFVESRCAAPRS